jgi:hypothetical protein
MTDYLGVLAMIILYLAAPAFLYVIRDTVIAAGYGAVVWHRQADERGRPIKRVSDLSSALCSLLSAKVFLRGGAAPPLRLGGQAGSSSGKIHNPIYI